MTADTYFGRSMLEDASADSSASAKSEGDATATAVGTAKSTGGTVSVDVTANSEVPILQTLTSSSRTSLFVRSRIPK